jgi:uncharacterized membrane protein
MSLRLALGHHVAPPRFVGFLLVSLGTFWAAFGGVDWSRAALMGFDAGAALFLLSIVPLLGKDPPAMRAAAERNDANRAVLLAITGIVCTTILVAIGFELGRKGDLHASGTALVIVTLLLAWLFSNMVYALHYAHLYYSQKDGGDARGLDFPGDDDPDYWDFVYFAFTLGMTFQTSDVEMSGRHMRRVAVTHCFAAFIFNIGVLAFTINILGGA